MARLGGIDGGEGFVGEPTSMARLLSGNFVLADRYHQGQLKVYRTDGAFVRTVGRRGRGPGEYEVINAVWALPDGGLEIYDFSLRRITRLDSDFTVVDTRPFGVPAALITRLRDGSHVTVQALAFDDAVGLPLHWVDTLGVRRASFGAEPAIDDLRDWPRHLRQLTPASDSSVWSGHYLRYRLEEWSIAGQRIRSLQRNVDWFPDAARGGFVDTDSPPETALRALHKDAEGLLWVVAWVADPDWREGLEMREDLYGRKRLRPGNPYDYFDSMIEVIDPARQAVVGRARIDLPVVGFAEDGVAFGYDEGGGAEPVVVLVRVQLSTP